MQFSKTCQFCGEAVADPFAQEPVTCRAAKCIAAAFHDSVRRQRESEQAAHRAAFKQNIEKARNHLVAEGTDPDEAGGFGIGIVPFNDGLPVAADPRRQETFKENLRNALMTFLDHDYVYDNEKVEYAPAKFDDLHVAACTACRGHCCRKGKDHAFLSPRRLEKLVDRDEPEVLEKTIQRYAEYLPEQSIDNSCIFHTSTGCALPAKMRASECHRFRCTELVDIEYWLDNSLGDRLYIAAMEDDEVRNGQKMTIRRDEP